MARKNNSRSENSGSITFDTRTKAVMAEVSLAQENIKEKVNAVREVIGGKSNNEIVLVLQYYDYNVEKAIQAYCDDGAKAALNAWNFPGNKAQTKKKKNRKKAAQKNSSDATPTPNGDLLNHSKENIPNGILENGSTSSKLTESDSELGGGGAYTCKSPGSLPSPTTSDASSTAMSEVPLSQNKQPRPVLDMRKNSPASTQAPRVNEPKISQTTTSLTSHPQPQRQLHHHQRQRTHSGSHSQRVRTNSERSSASAHGDHRPPIHYRVHAGLEKSVKDLHRQTVSLERLRLVLNEEVEKTYKRIKSVFEEMRTCLNNREAQMLSEMDQVKLAAHDIYAMRQKTAMELKVKVDRSESMNDQELAELRSEIKHFVSDRKVDEDLGRTTRFLYDSDHLRDEIAQFAEVVPVKCVYSKRRPSTSSIASSGAGEEPDSLSSSVNGPTSTNTASGDPVQHMTLDVEETHEMAELQKRLQGQLQLQGIGEKSQKSENKSRSTTGSSEGNIRQSGQDVSASHVVSKTQEGSERRETTPHQSGEGQGRPGSGVNRSSYYYRGRGRGRGGDRNRGGGGRGAYRGRGDGRPRSPRKDGGQGGGQNRDNQSQGSRNSNSQNRPRSYDNQRQNPQN